MTKFFNLTTSPLLFSLLQGSTWRSVSLPALGSIASTGTELDSRGQLLLSQGKLAQYDGQEAAKTTDSRAFTAADITRMIERMTTCPIVVGNAGARLALTALQATGHIVVQADANTSWILAHGSNPASADSWVQIGYSSISVANVTGLTAALAAEAAKQSALVAVVARNLAVEVTRSTSSYPDNLTIHPGPLYLTGVDSLTGGGSAALDGIPTVGMPVGAVRDVVIGGAASEWQLRAGSATTDLGTGIIRPLDYDVWNNSVNWVRLSFADRTQTSLDRAAVASALAEVTADLVTITAASNAAVAAAQSAEAAAQSAADSAAQVALLAVNSWASYTHNQGTPAAVWTITHNLGRYPSVTVVDSAGTFVVGEIRYVSNQQITATFSSAFSGSAYLN